MVRKDSGLDEDEDISGDNYISPALIIHLLGKTYNWTDTYILSLRPAHIIQKLDDIRKEYEVQKKEMDKVGKKRADGSSMFTKKRRDSSFADAINKAQLELSQKYDTPESRLSDKWKFIPTIKGQANG